MFANDLKNVERNMEAFNDANFAPGFIMCSIKCVLREWTVFCLAISFN